MRERIIYSGAHLRAIVWGEAPDRVIFTFDHWRPDRTGMAGRPGPAFLKRGLTHVQVTTAENDWFLNHDLPECLTAIERFARPFRVRLGLGFSMGGYGLLLASRVVAFDRALFVSPQTTFAPDLPRGCAIGDARFSYGRMDTHFAREAHGVIRDTPKAAGDVVILYDPELADDARHAEEVARLFLTPRLVGLRGAGHPVTAAFPSSHGFKLLTDALLSDPIRVDRITSAHRRWRQIRAREALAPDACDWVVGV
ncbi:hypothetical protein [Maritimibacter dapengensis]|uniref:Alpha/beta hydrolase n=1 Tax=Maritimibacter dapengensis TaxID=2836868 RepID=A0ABS6SWP4_9RHOB|nr:hypothetical protein [Maritimibacter dapengensis]MBV7377352.1 hypothetical protein [Maritimibacter dapengensis]